MSRVVWLADDIKYAVLSVVRSPILTIAASGYSTLAVESLMTGQKKLGSVPQIQVKRWRDERNEPNFKTIKTHLCLFVVVNIRRTRKKGKKSTVVFCSH